jgi:hypothetical protein
MKWLLAFAIALAFSGAVLLAFSVTKMRRGGLGPVPTPPAWHPEYNPVRARHTENIWGRMNAHFIAHHWFVSRVAAAELALGLGGLAAIPWTMASRPWLQEILPFACLMVVPIVLFTCLAGMTATVLRRLRELAKRDLGRGGLGRTRPAP